MKIEHIYSEETIENVGNKNRLHAFKEGREELLVVFEWVVEGGTTVISISNKHSSKVRSSVLSCGFSGLSLVLNKEGCD